MTGGVPVEPGQQVVQVEAGMAGKPASGADASAPQVGEVLVTATEIVQREVLLQVIERNRCPESPAPTARSRSARRSRPRGGRAQACCDLAGPYGAEWAATTAEREAPHVRDARFLAFREQPHVTGMPVLYRRDGCDRPGLGKLGGFHHGHLPLRALPDGAGSVAERIGPAPPACVSPHPDPCGSPMKYVTLPCAGP